MPNYVDKLFKDFEELCYGFDKMQVFFRVGLVSEGLDGVCGVREDVP